jgi:hypothetical protein
MLLLVAACGHGREAVVADVVVRSSRHSAIDLVDASADTAVHSIHAANEEAGSESRKPTPRPFLLSPALMSLWHQPAPVHRIRSGRWRGEVAVDEALLTGIYGSGSRCGASPTAPGGGAARGRRVRLGQHHTWPELRRRVVVGLQRCVAGRRGEVRALGGEDSKKKIRLTRFFFVGRCRAGAWGKAARTMGSIGRRRTRRLPAPDPGGH